MSHHCVYRLVKFLPQKYRTNKRGECTRTELGSRMTVRKGCRLRRAIELPPEGVVRARWQKPEWCTAHDPAAAFRIILSLATVLRDLPFAASRIH